MIYTEFVTAITQYCENYETTFVSQVPRFVRNAERRIYMAARLPRYRKRQTSNLAIGTQYMTLPADFLTGYSLEVSVGGETRFLDEREPEYVRIAFPTSTQGIPRVYAQENDTTFLIGPVPDNTYAVEMSYFYFPQSVVDSGTTATWLATNFDQVILYGALVEAYIFMKAEADIIAGVRQTYTESLQQLIDFSKQGAGPDRLRAAA